MQHSKSLRFVKLAAIAAAISVQGVALAASPAASPDAAPTATAQQAPEQGARDHKFSRHHKAGHGHHHRQHRDAALLVPGYGALGEKAVATLALTADQQKLVADAQTAQKAARKEQFEGFKAQKQARAEQLKAGKLDPHAALKQSGEVMKKARTQRGQITDKWLAVWDSLDSSQQQKVAAHFAERASERADRMEKRAERNKAKQDKAAPKAPVAAESASS